MHFLQRSGKTENIWLESFFSSKNAWKNLVVKCFEKVEKNFVKVQRDDQKITFRHKNRICKIFYEMEMVNVNKDLRTRFELTNNLGHLN